MPRVPIRASGPSHLRRAVRPHTPGRRGRIALRGVCWLLISLDNPANPVLRLRQAVYRRVGRLGGLIPFYMGCTLSRARLVAALEEVGFETLESRYVVHVPRVAGLWLCEWAARSGRPRLGRGLRLLFDRLERLLRRLPTRAWTGYFVAVDCARRG